MVKEEFKGTRKYITGLTKEGMEIYLVIEENQILKTAYPIGKW